MEAEKLGQLRETLTRPAVPQIVERASLQFVEPASP